MTGMAAITVSDRITLVRSILTPFPDAADVPHRDRFGRLVDSYGVSRVFEYALQRGIAHAVLASHEWHPAVRDEDGPFQLFAHICRAIAKLHQAELARIADAFSASGIPMLAYKGIVLDLLLGNQSVPSFSEDIDLLVRRGAVTHARKVLESLGYGTDLRIASGRVRRMPAHLVRVTEQSIYSFGQCQPHDKLVPIPELEPLAGAVQALMPGRFCTSSRRLHVKMSVDLHYTLNLLTDDIGTRVKPPEAVWWEATQPVKIGDRDVSTLSDQVLSWSLPHRLYVDAMLFQQRSIKSVCHMKLLSLAGRLDVPHVVEVARRFPYLAPSLHYLLRAADVLCGLGTGAAADPAELRQMTAPTMNLGDCLPTLLDVAVAFELDGTGGACHGSEHVSARIC